MLRAELTRVLDDAGLIGGARVLVACSGGLDSVALLHATVELLGSARVVAGHVDHRVRIGSQEDASFVEELCRELGCESRVSRLLPGSSSEARLRELRYAALEEQRAATGATTILLAHHAEDQAETVLLSLLRQTRWFSLAGMPAAREALLRPFLRLPRREIFRYARAERLSWREDPTNREPRYLRNRIRRELLPLIELRYRPGFGERLAALAEEVAAFQYEEP